MISFEIPHSIPHSTTAVRSILVIGHTASPLVGAPCLSRGVTQQLTLGVQIQSAMNVPDREGLDFVHL